jgi:hypothetical protein
LRIVLARIGFCRLVPRLSSLLGKWGSLNLLELIMPTTLSKYRFKVYIQQAGLCIYCEYPMWLNDIDTFSIQHQLTTKQAMIFKCTAEHLQAKQDGGTDNANNNNIAAACSYCNQRRHKRKRPLDPIAFKLHVMRRLAKGLWHSNMVNRFVVEASQRFLAFSFTAFQTNCTFSYDQNSPTPRPKLGR